MRLGVVVPGDRLPLWQVEGLRALLALPGIELCLSIRAEGNQRRGMMPDGGWLWRQYRDLWLLPRSRSLRLALAGDLLGNAPTLAWPESTALPLKLSAHRLDVILDWYSDLPADTSRLTGCRIWSLRVGSGNPPAFHEIARGEPVVSIGMDECDPLGRRRSIAAGVLKPPNHLYVRCLDELLFTAAGWPTWVCRTPSGVAGQPARVYLPPIERDRYITNWQAMNFLLALWCNYIRTLYRFLLREQRWAIGIIPAPIHALLGPGPLPAARWIETGDSLHSLADPFVACTGEKLTLLAERIEHRTGLGRIVALQVCTGTASLLGLPEEVIAPPNHIAYPYVVHHDGETYCIPDTAITGRVDLYRATSGTGDWVLETTLIDNVHALDPTIFQHEGLWWLLCTDGVSGAQTNLLGWCAEALHGPWLPHPANPLKIDVRSSRPAGTPFIHEGTLYRPAQDCSQTYGGGITINRVLRLTPTEFREEPVASIHPFAGSYDQGIHTVCAAGNVTVIDGKYTRIAASLLSQKLRHILRRAAIAWKQ